MYQTKQYGDSSTMGTDGDSARVITPADEEVLERLVGSGTFSRGIGYAQAGAVRKRTWSPGGTHVVGEVQGGSPKPYVASVVLTRSRSQRLSAFQATCTCPVGTNCKHAVALVLAEEPTVHSGRAPLLTLVKSDSAPSPRDRGANASDDRAIDGSRADGSPRPEARPDSGPTDWELPLQALLDPDGGETAEAASTEIGLQFELVLEAGRPGARGPAAGGPGIRVRPVVPGRNGNWVRTGISWTNLEYFRYGATRTSEADERILLVKEVLALSRLASRRSTYSYSDEVVRLESINSRRLWDLLGEARAVGLPLVQSRRGGEPVTLLPTDVAVTIDVTRTESGLRVEPRVGNESRVLPLERSMLIGRPAHGIAWWDVGTGSTASAQPLGLGLAALASPVDDNLRTFLRMATIDVPHDDEKRFMRAFVPKLRQKVELASSDGSVDLPDVRPTLVLAIQADDGHRIGLTWTRGVAGVEGKESLWGAPRRIHERAAEDSILEEVMAVVRPVTELFERTPFGTRLAPEAQLAGMAAVQFLTELVPLLESIEGVKIERMGMLPDYREAAVAPVVILGGSESADNDWFDLTIDVSVGGEEVPFAELFVALAASQSHLVLPSGTYFSLDREELRELSRLIAEARTLHDAPGDGIRLNRFQASLWEDLQRLGVVTVQAGQWEASVRALVERDRPGRASSSREPARHPPAVSAHRVQLVGLPL